MMLSQGSVNGAEMSPLKKSSRGLAPEVVRRISFFYS